MVGPAQIVFAATDVAGTLTGLNLALSIVCAMLALLWVPASSHCEVSDVIGLVSGHSEDCSDHPSSAPGCDHCSLCQTLDGGVVGTFSDKLDFKPALLPVFSYGSAEVLTFLEDVSQTADLPSPPPRELPPASWQFLQRSALAPRAPSLAS